MRLPEGISSWRLSTLHWSTWCVLSRLGWVVSSTCRWGQRLVSSRDTAEVSIYGMLSFPLTNSYFSRLFKPPTSMNYIISIRLWPMNNGYGVYGMSENGLFTKDDKHQRHLRFRGTSIFWPTHGHLGQQIEGTTYISTCCSAPVCCVCWFITQPNTPSNCIYGGFLKCGHPYINQPFWGSHLWKPPIYIYIYIYTYIYIYIHQKP